ncbi:aminodeoxychorismate synthase component I [Thermodesulfobacterium hydrogeniphilum]|uniref:aminodeoxychorismate synthase component I n=1 Tax=Thermodesulfobacterium hydrogeniphilum TaxID=161156 RepID=UPI000691A13E|nr:aminodeoxychorismate synthase component I [Thermodesulfobacterium hydrogeniphilum]
MNEAFLWIKADKIPYQVISFVYPLEKLILTDPQYIKIYFKILQKKIEKGFYAFGFLSYELGYYLEPKLKIWAKNTRLPLAYFVICKDLKKFFLTPDPNFSQEDCKISNLRLNLEKKKYIKAIEKIKNYIASGDVYQINFTFKAKFRFKGDPKKFFKSLLFSQRCKYAFYLENESFCILSLSPELFLRKKGRNLKSSPMKGTVSRANLWKEDLKIRNFLRKDVKNQAENIMITDLIRNDLGRICEKGSVYVSELFKVETYPTLHQMISSVEGTLNTEDFYEIIKALFPCGSVTGAPKIRAMEIISELEKEAREVYTGAVGFITPEKDFLFNVAIRTLVLWKKRKEYEGEAGIGSGVVWDSIPEEEYKESILKAKFFTKTIPYFELIETFYYENGKENPLLKYHYKRLKESAKYFNFRIPQELKNFEKFKTFIDKKAGHLEFKKYKGRLLLSPSGEISLSFSEFESWPGKIKIGLVKRNFDLDRFFYHKTTYRKPLNDYFFKAKELGLTEIVFYNEKREILEGTISNIYIKIGNILYTPPLNLGILNGVLRRFLISQKRVKEKKIYLEDLRKAEEIYIGNALRGLGKVIEWYILD